MECARAHADVLPWRHSRRLLFASSYLCAAEAHSNSVDVVGGKRGRRRIFACDWRGGMEGDRQPRRDNTCIKRHDKSTNTQHYVCIKGLRTGRAGCGAGCRRRRHAAPRWRPPHPLAAALAQQHGRFRRRRCRHPPRPRWPRRRARKCRPSCSATLPRSRLVVDVMRVRISHDSTRFIQSPPPPPPPRPTPTTDGRTQEQI